MILKFSHIYDKMEDSESQVVPRTALLMEVFIVNSEDLHPRFVEYDTSYWEHLKHCSYKLPKGKVIVLLLKSDVYGSMIWTTIRRYTEKKYEYYRKNRWNDFKIVIEEKGGE